MAYNNNDIPQVGKIKAMLTRIQSKLTALETSNSAAIKSVAVSGNTVNFYTSSDTSGTASFTFDFPEEIFLDQASTSLVENFSWSASTYPGSTNPNLDGKTVLVLAVKGDKQTNPTTNYSFINLEKLIDPYAASDTSLLISGYNIAVNISSDTNNILALTPDGLFVDGRNLGSDKINKVTTPTAGNVPFLASDGSLVNSTVVGADILTKVSGAVTGNIVIFSNTGIVDSGNRFCTDAEFTEMLDEVFPTVSGGGGA